MKHNDSPSCVQKRKFNEDNNNICAHVYLNHWGGDYHCVDCNDLITDISRIATEDNEQSKIKLIDQNNMKDFIQQESLTSEHMSQRRGVPIGWLVQWTQQHDCWEWPTRRVQRELVLPHTAVTRCRYVELEGVREVVGPACTFVSHTW